jgi:hypothetical protein
VVVVAAYGPKEEYAISTACLEYWIKADTGILAIVFLSFTFVVFYTVYR